MSFDLTAKIMLLSLWVFGLLTVAQRLGFAH
jgi:hypothetical protein